MLISIFGESIELVDLLAKLAPAATIVAAIIAAKTQFRNARRLNQETVAKNHYRELLQIFIDNSDVTPRGSTPERLDELRRDLVEYGRYSWIFTATCFAMQEMYLAIDLKKDANWGNMIRTFISIFRNYILSERDFPPFMQQTLDPGFLEYVMETARNYQHPKYQLSLDQAAAR